MISLTYPISEMYISSISQHFGENPSWYSKFGLPGHNGIDFAVPIGTPVYASAQGIVTLVGNQSTGYGKHVRLTHTQEDGSVYRTLYAHLSSTLAVADQFIAQGEIIGYSGNTGNSTGPHLHFELRDLSLTIHNASDPTGYWGGVYFDGAIDPMPYLINPIPNPQPPIPNPYGLPTSLTIVAAGLRLRKQPNPDGEFICYLPINYNITSILDQSVKPNGTTWYKIKYNNSTGWACAVLTTTNVYMESHQ